VRDEAQVDRAADSVHSDLGLPNVLVNCVGRLGPFDQKVWEYTNDEWGGVFEVNLYGAMNCIRAFLPAMRTLKNHSHIVNVASSVGLHPTNHAGAYTASNHALVAYTEALSRDLAEEHSLVGVSLVCPGLVRTNFNSEIRDADSVAQSTDHEWLDPDEVARCVIDALQRDDLYVFTHKTTRERIEAYQRLINASLLD
jgi:NAD(P)-dependent dehydrogenase (short-subunit alcohol dehydrogenase family)